MVLLRKGKTDPPKRTVYTHMKGYVAPCQTVPKSKHSVFFLYSQTVNHVMTAIRVFYQAREKALRIRLCGC